MIAVIGTFRLPSESVAEARRLMQAVITATRAEPGCKAYSYAEDVAEPGLFRVAEQWESREALTAHFETPHMQRWTQQRAALGFHDREISIHSLGPPEAI